jgi:hypothetical protein
MSYSYVALAMKITTTIFRYEAGIPRNCDICMWSKGIDQMDLTLGHGHIYVSMLRGSFCAKVNFNETTKYRSC